MRAAAASKIGDRELPSIDPRAEQSVEVHSTWHRSALEKYDPNATTELGRVKRTEKAAKENNGAGLVEALKDTAKWVLDFATKIGTSVIAKIIEKQIGLDSHP
jgi:hypothetical protein